MKTKATKKPKRSVRKPKAERASLDKRIAAAETFDEKRRLALFGREQRLTSLQDLARRWAFIRWLREHPEMRSAKTVSGYFAVDGKLKSVASKHDDFVRLNDSAVKETEIFFTAAMSGNRPDFLRALASEMERQNRAKEFEPDKLRFAYLHASQSGEPINLSKLARRLATEEFSSDGKLSPLRRGTLIEERAQSYLKTLQRFKKRIGGMSRPRR